MRSTPFDLSLLAATALILAACGSDSGDSAAESGDQAPPAQQAAQDNGDGSALVISNRTYTAGTAQVKLSGFVESNGSQTLNLPASISDAGHTWLQYGVSGSQELDVLFTNDEELVESGVTIGVGPRTVTVVSGDCQTKFDVTPTTVTGHFSCPKSTGYDPKSGQMGDVSVEVDFNATS